MRSFIPIIALVFLLTACASNQSSPEAQAYQRVTQGCTVYARTLQSLAMMRASGSLTDGQVAIVDEWRPLLNGVCLGDAPMESGDALDLLERGLFELSKVENPK